MSAIGIDLGTTYSCVGVFRHNRVDILANDMGNRTTPSYVAFTEDERLVGDAAKNQCAMNPLNTVFDAKRMIGRKFSDPIIPNGHSSSSAAMATDQRSKSSSRARQNNSSQKKSPPWSSAR